MLEITARQHPKPGHQGYRYDAIHDGRVLCTALDPFTAGARILLQEGHDPGQPVAFVVVGKPALLGRLGRVGALTVENSPLGRPRFRKAPGRFKGGKRETYPPQNTIGEAV